MSLKKFIYLMINAIKRQNNIKRFDKISDKALESLNDFFTQLKESTINNLHKLLEN